MGTAHAIVGVGMTREALYVAATRGRESNRLYVDVEPEPANAGMAHGPTERLAAREVLLAVVSRRGAELSAHQTMASEWARAASFEQLAREHQSLVAAAMAQRWEAVLGQAGLPPAPAGQGGTVARVGRPARGAARCRGPRPRRQGRPVRAGEAADRPRPGPRLGPAGAVAALGRGGRGALEPAARPGGRPRPQGRQRGRRASWPERSASARHAIARRAHDLAEHAVRAGAPWARALRAAARLTPLWPDAWWGRLAVVAAYRDRWHVTDASILGDKERRLPPASCSSCPGIACRRRRPPAWLGWFLSCSHQCRLPQALKSGQRWASDPNRAAQQMGPRAGSRRGEGVASSFFSPSQNPARPSSSQRAGRPPRPGQARCRQVSVCCSGQPSGAGRQLLLYALRPALRGTGVGTEPLNFRRFRGPATGRHRAAHLELVGEHRLVDELAGNWWSLRRDRVLGSSRQESKALTVPHD